MTDASAPSEALHHSNRLLIEALRALAEAGVLVNDHDPRPLYYQFEAEQPGKFGWEYLERGPEVWRVRITRQAARSGTRCG